MQLAKEQQLLILGLVLSLLIGLGVMYFNPGNASPGLTILPPETAPKVEVHLCGAVRNEGVYLVQGGDRLIDVIRMAGGSLPTADLSSVNLAEPVKDGQKIVIPLKVVLLMESGGAAAPGGKVSLNFSDEKAFDDLPGVGASTAKAIVVYRKKNGPFTRIEQIMEIPRFGKAKFEKIKGQLVL
ncbi:MAG: ComEA family DNA-binding protein [Candidatus Margulisbacteria bacterium]|nr:ComEA family DNA-binding protein [Candidatus Margulisiibacteriota bacterium]MBU1617467.1 ComEA family DNA-binding protein [Candidatus Margulisiibacteriota bacterium]MBU1866873.1 ComEA family DNA-binding protein [Candidatus Margulisiibacteriota bacterium]